MAKGPRENEGKTAGQLAYEAAGDWVEQNPGSTEKPLPTWEMLDVRAREYWDRIGAAVRAPLVAGLKTLIECERCSNEPPSGIRGLWWQAR